MADNFSEFDRGLPFEEISEIEVLTSNFENGVVQKRAKWHTFRKRWRIRFKANTKEEILAIRDYFVARDGSVETFSFTEPLESTLYTVRFVNDSFTLERQHYGVYNATVELEEVL